MRRSRAMIAGRFATLARRGDDRRSYEITVKQSLGRASPT